MSSFGFLSFCSYLLCVPGFVPGAAQDSVDGRSFLSHFEQGICLFCKNQFPAGKIIPAYRINNEERLVRKVVFNRDLFVPQKS
jgi:hypothetical protein